MENTATTLSTVDGLLMPHRVMDGFPAVDLYQDRWLCLVADDHPEIGAGLTMDQLAPGVQQGRHDDHFATLAQQ